MNGFVDVDPDKIFDVYSNICRGPNILEKSYAERMHTCITSAIEYLLIAIRSTLMLL